MEEESSTKALTVYHKMHVVRETLREEGIEKSGVNESEGFSYFELHDFLPRALELFKGANLFSFVSFTKEDATLTIINLDNPEERLVTTAPMTTATDKRLHPVQSLGASMTYIRRYLYINALELIEKDALDAVSKRYQKAKENVMDRFTEEPPPVEQQPAPKRQGSTKK